MDTARQTMQFWISRMVLHRRWVNLVLSLCPWWCACSGTPVAADQNALLGEGGWHDVNGHPCYFPPRFDKITDVTQRKVVRGRAYTEAMRRWQGIKDPSFVLSEDMLSALEPVLLSSPERIEWVLAEDHERCVAYQQGVLSRDAYLAWYWSLLNRLEAEDCRHAPYELVTQYVLVELEWQGAITVCRDEQLQLKANNGRFTTAFHEGSSEQQWLDAAGDTGSATVDLSHPCHADGCRHGQLIARFTDRQGGEIIFPVGLGTWFAATTHGTLSFAINDPKPEDNRLFSENDVSDYLLVEIRPALSNNDANGP